jgi:hypothetical protein
MDKGKAELGLIGQIVTGLLYMIKLFPFLWWNKRRTY